ncbi:MAG: hypothetical protein ACQCXQ_13395 [Verrucomicrobiales bacterium]|nr:hypothetical protein [Verrucomicrobiota bacterium JB025]
MNSPIAVAASLTILGSATAGTVVTDAKNPIPSAPADAFANARRPISNPTLFDLALPSSNIHPIFIYHSLPDQISTKLGNLDLGGDVEVYALQFEYALTDRLSIVATKDGYVDMNPNALLSTENGWANLGGGLKYAFILNPETGTALSGTATFEFPTGNSDVFQGEGDGAVNLIVSGLQMADQWQFAGALGFQIPFSDEQSTSSFLSTHVSYEVTPWFIPLVELNWFHVIDAGDGAGNFSSQVGGAVPAVVQFEGGDFFNLGAEFADENRDIVTAAFGFRSRITDNVQAGFAYEIPLTDEETNLMEQRFTLDLVWSF